MNATPEVIEVYSWAQVVPVVWNAMSIPVIPFGSTNVGVIVTVLPAGRFTVNAGAPPGHWAKICPLVLVVIELGVRTSVGVEAPEGVAQVVVNGGPGGEET